MTAAGSAPSYYEPDSTNKAAHQSGDREWLGASPVASDGVVFVTFDQTNGINIQVTVSSITNMSLDSGYETDAPPVLYLSGWIDWNKDFTWDLSEQVVSGSGPADFDGSQVLTFNFPMPAGFTGSTWARFRLARGQPASPLGLARFGEVEDYEIPATAVRRLNIFLTPTNTAVVSWPSPSIGFNLQVNTNLATTNWVTPAEIVTDNGTNKYIIVSPPTGNRFFRLKNP